MAETLGTLVKDFEFTSETRSLVTLVGEVRLDPERGVAELRPDADGFFPTSGDHYVVGPLFQPTAVRQWLAFQAVIQHGFDGLAQVTGDGYRLHDGTSQYRWSGSAWVVDSAGWNTEAEVAANIASFPVTARKLRPVVRLTTTDKRRTPTLRVVKVAWSAKVHYLEDIVYRTLVPLLRSLRFLSDFGFTSSGAASFNVGTLVSQAGVPFNLVGVDSVFDGTADPERRTDKLASYDPATKVATLTSAIPSGRKVVAMVSVEPEVSVETTSGDFTEVEKVPALVLTEVEAAEGSSPLAAEDGVVNKATGAAVRVLPPYRVDLRFTLTALAPGGVDLLRMTEAVMSLAEATPQLRSPALDRSYRLWLVEEFRGQTTPSLSDLHSAQARLVVKDVLMWKRPAPPGEVGVKAVVFTGDDWLPSAFDGGFSGGFR